ncbi:MAG: hypothetical protein ABIR68_02485 [Ilumatobacteraceae bacterium]
MGRRMMIAAVPLVSALTLMACGSDKKSPSTVPAATTTIGGQQAPNAGGNNNSGGQNPQTNSVPESAPSASTGATPDTQEKIGDQSPGMGSGTP